MKNNPPNFPHQYLNIISFDGDCMFCKKWVQRVIKKDRRHHFHFCALSSKTGNTLSENLQDSNIDSLIYYSKGTTYIQSSAVIQIMRDMTFPYSMAVIFKIIPVFFRDKIYQLIAKHRHRLSTTNDQCSLFEKEMHQDRFID